MTNQHDPKGGIMKQRYKINMGKVKKHCNLSPYLGLVRHEIKQNCNEFLIDKEEMDDKPMYIGIGEPLLGKIYVPKYAFEVIES